MKQTSSSLRRPWDRPNLLTASGGMRVLAACAVLLLLWGVIYWASLLP